MKDFSNGFRFDSWLRPHRLRLRPLRRVRAAADGQVGIVVVVDDVIIRTTHARLVPHARQRPELGRDGAVLLRLVLLPRHPRLPRRRIFCGTLPDRVPQQVRLGGKTTVHQAKGSV